MFSSLNLNLFLILIFIFSGAVLALVLTTQIKKYIHSHRAVKRVLTSQRAEKGAEKLLKKHGFQILERQQTRPLIIKIGRRIHHYLIRIDFLVKKGNKKYIVEVKNGHKNSYITNRDTRRQLLEYFLAYQSCDIILLNMKNKKFSRIKFDLPYFHTQWIENLIFFFLGILAVLITIYFLK